MSKDSVNLFGTTVSRKTLVVSFTIGFILGTIVTLIMY